ncbi:prepilin peptidase [Cereibacter sphaeroides]|uniref:prepilin peptidase n=1 Tax=Cereibacter sphaeroides TaxID=1063 RepID=UPI001F445986|nr:prepilin peptidase [Cereibacter sphaeroides]MCE6951923.1 prepilin peptidase [Cereibacter sphaeroides]
MQGLIATPAPAALWFLPFAVPVALWVAWSDMKFMKIPNKAVMALVGVYLVVGPIALPLEDWAWRWLHLAVVLVTGFVMNLGRLIGAGDAKFAAAMAPFFALGDLRLALALLAASLIGAFASHRGLGLVPPFRNATADWESWRRRDFPMGLALSGMLILYLLLAVFDA